MDRAVLEQLSDPLMHLVRNRVDHGIETVDERRDAGKDAEAVVSVSASLRGSQVDIFVSDVGAGLNFERIRRKMRERGLPEPTEDKELLRSLFLTGFSTATRITNISGRGVGLDVVKSQVESLHGTIDVSSEPGFGTRFMLSVPLTLTTLSALFIRLGGQTFALPTRNVVKLVRFRASDLRLSQGRSVLSLGQAPIPVADLCTVFGLAQHTQLTGDEWLHGALLQSNGRRVIIAIDEALAEGDVVIKNLGPRIHRLRFVAGGVLQRSGQVVLLLNAAAVVQTAVGDEALVNPASGCRRSHNRSQVFKPNPGC